MKKEFTVDVKEEDITAVEKAHYEWSAARDTARFLMSDSTVDKDNLASYLESVEKKFVVIEKLKEEVGAKYAPNEVDLKKFNYQFDFNNHCIIYTEA